MSQPSMNQTDMGGLPSAVSWQLQLLAGVITLILGIILTVQGAGALNVICVILGLLLIMGGVFHFVRALDRFEHHRVWLTIAGIVEVVIGVVFIRHLGFTQTLIALWIGIVWIIQGIVGLLAGIIGTPGRSRVWPLLFGLISLAAGIIVVSLPHESLATLVWVLGIIFMLMGVMEVLGGFFIRHDLKKAE